MNRSITISRNIVLAGGVVQLILGMLFWADTGKALVPVHIVVGVIVAVSLGTLAVRALQAKAPKPLGFLVVAWAILLPVVGGTQTFLLVGSSHWIIRVLHLLVGVLAMGLASILAGKVLPSRPKVDWAEPNTADQ